MTAPTNEGGAAVQRGLVVMDYGTPSGPDEVEAYYTHIRRGRPPNAEQLADLQRRYDAIGGVSPLAQRTHDQARALAAHLERLDREEHLAHREGDRGRSQDGGERGDPGRSRGGWQVTLGHKHAPPFVEDAVAELARSGVTQLVGLVLAPHYSRGSVGEYHERAGATADQLGVPYVGIESWHEEPAWLDAMADRVRSALTDLPEATKVLFTAHSLPERVLVGDPYPDQLWTSATEIARRVQLDPWWGWSLAWQSAGRTPEPWRGPDVAEVVRELGATGRAAGVLVCPQGFVSDHLEVLYDLDIDCHRVAAEAGLAFRRTRSLNDDPAVMAALAARVRRTARSSSGATSSTASSSQGR